MSELEKWALLIASDVRIAVVSILGSHPMKYEEMEGGIEENLGREVSHGSLQWHLGKLQLAGIIEETAHLWRLTPLGRGFYEKLREAEQ